MKRLSVILFLFLFQTAFPQSYCPPNGITTNPANPINPQQPTYRNFFNWASTTPYYSINSSCIPSGSTTNPFQSGQTELLPLSVTQDNKPADGWEVVAYNLGYDNNNVALSSQPQHTYVMLYNKFTGMLRILVKWCPISSYNGALLTLKFAPSPAGFQTNVLDMATGEKPLSSPHILNPSLSTTLNFYNDSESWAYADFKMNYDPCTCSFSDNARLALYTDLISSSDVQLTGKITGIISAAGSGNSNANGNFWKSAANINSNMMKVHKGITDFTQNYQQIYQHLNDAGVTIGAINSIGNFLSTNSFMQAGLKALPYISTGVKFLTGLFGGGGSGAVAIPPLSVNLDVKISGTITTQDPMHNVTVGLPGSQKQNVLPGTTGGQPLYNETMGIFSLFNAPVMYYQDVTEMKEFINREKIGTSSPYDYMEFKNPYNFVTRNYKMSGETLKYAINPASGLVLQDAEVMLIAEYEKPSLIYSNAYPSPKVINVDLDKNNGVAITGTDTGPAIDITNSMFQNAFKPIGINNYKNDYAFSFLYSVTPLLGKKRELNYNPNVPSYQAFSCQDFTCSWATNTSIRAFSYVQSQPFSPVLSSLSWTHFKVKTNNVFPFSDTPLPEFLAPRVKTFKLKFVLNLKRTDVPDAQNVLYVVTYPIEMKPAPVGYVMTGSNYIADAQTYHDQVGFDPAVPTNKVVPISVSELTTFCSTLYKTATTRTSATGKMAGDVKEADMYAANTPVLYPVPAKDRLHIVLNECRIKAITDLYGQTVKKFSNAEVRDGEIETDISGLKTGLYLLSYEDKDGYTRSVKFTIE
jgi:hypothetical protein